MLCECLKSRWQCEASINSVRKRQPNERKRVLEIGRVCSSSPFGGRRSLHECVQTCAVALDGALH